jgi:hypothetical protein
MKHLVYSIVIATLLLGACHPNTTSNAVTAEMAYKGVANYCQHEFDWTPATEDSITMYVTMGQETDSTYQVIFRSYTAALTYFYVNKANGSTRLVEYVPGLEIESEAGTINLYDYLELCGTP